jgi:hypothetical protein
MFARSSSVIPGGRGSIPAGKRGANRGCGMLSLWAVRCSMQSQHQIYQCVPVRSGPSPLMQTPIYYPKAEFIETVGVTGFDKKDIADIVTVKDTGNKVSRRATISGPQNIILGGKTIISNGAIIRGDLKRAGPGHAVVISLGRYCLVGEGCVMRCVSSLLSHFCPTQSTSHRVARSGRHTRRIVVHSTITR